MRCCGCGRWHGRRLLNRRFTVCRRCSDGPVPCGARRVPDAGGAEAGSSLGRRSPPSCHGEACARRAGHTAGGGADGEPDGVDYTRYTTVDGEGTQACPGKDTGVWPAWVFSPGIQLMARRLRVRELSLEFLSLIDSMMAVNPADRPTAEAVLLDSPVFGMRMPWWEKVVEKAVRRVVEGKENVLLDVCVGDSDEEEEEDEEEAALVRRTMMPLVLPAENHGYVPHNVIHWWNVDLTRGEPDHTKWLSPTSLLASLLTTVRDLTGLEAARDAQDPVLREVRCTPPLRCSLLSVCACPFARYRCFSQEN
ncbi:putative serine/threonine protein kinase [Trypanosoma cruzi]|uniref:Putative serine/threonine protein kinase n=1 Tax=Trypanosoma cruzi TaxID=5693 RepID=A0A2V2WDE6_TRYCR|nr:putative serine/threonine protein kinase [Trypanosoma cruzi]